MNAPLAEMFRFNRWATMALVEGCSTLSDEQLDAQVPGIGAPVRRLLLHFVGGQQTFALRTCGRQHEGELNGGSPWPGFAALLEAAARSSDDLLAAAEALDEDHEVTLPWQGQNPRFPVGFILAHAFAHGVEHRTEIKLILAQHGVRTPDLDGWQYAAAAEYGREG